MNSERALWAAVLDQAVADLACTANAFRQDPPHSQQSARAWLLSNGREIGSFLYVCTVLDIGPTWLRKCLFGLPLDTLRDRVASYH